MKKRYFLIAYLSVNDAGQIDIVDTKFPTFTEIKQKVGKVSGRDQAIALTNIFEFKSKKDYENFIK